MRCSSGPIYQEKRRRVIDSGVGPGTGGAGQKERPKYPEKSLRTTIAERMVETRAELPFIGDQIVCLSHDQAARSGPASMSWGPESGWRLATREGRWCRALT